MFSQIRNRLTLFYTGAMVLFLLAFLATTYVSLIWVLFLQQERELLAYAEEESHEHIAIFRQAQLPDAHPTPDEEVSGVLFFYAFDTSGRRIHALEPSQPLQAPTLALISRWELPPNEIKLEKITHEEQTHYVLLASRFIYDKGQTLGIIYVGKDLTSYYEVLKTILAVTLVLCLIFLLAASWFGHLLAARAMVAVSLAFHRQQEFTADASHELRTPLSVLLASTEAVQTDEDSCLSAFSSQVITDMKDEILRMTKIVSNLLTLARVDAGATSLEKEQFQLNDLAQQIMRSLGPVARKKGIAIKLITSNEVPLYADRQRIEQLLLILLDNAIKNTPGGGSVVLQLSAKSGQTEVSVRDTGIGIAKEDQSKIFERFYRVDKARSRETGGTGLGLSIAKWIVDAHEGTIGVESSVGQGSKFVVLLPQRSVVKGRKPELPVSKDLP